MDTEKNELKHFKQIASDVETILNKISEAMESNKYQKAMKLCAEYGSKKDDLDEQYLSAYQWLQEQEGEKLDDFKDMSDRKSEIEKRFNEIILD